MYVTQVRSLHLARSGIEQYTMSGKPDATDLCKDLAEPPRDCPWELIELSALVSYPRSDVSKYIIFNAIALSIIDLVIVQTASWPHFALEIVALFSQNFSGACLHISSHNLLLSSGEILS